MAERDPISALISDLRWQIDQMPLRGIKDTAGNPYVPAHYKRGLLVAIDKGGPAVSEYVLRYVNKAPSSTFKKLEEADSLDLACEALVADADKPYAHLFEDADRARAQKRLAPHIGAIENRKAAQDDRIAQHIAGLPDDVALLRELAVAATHPEEAIAINSQILVQAPGDVVALNRLGRAYESTGAIDRAVETFKAVLENDPANPIATRRLSDLDRNKQATAVAVTDA
jgi:tetratricopeptide (TPR) repeat protein